MELTRRLVDGASTQVKRALHIVKLTEAAGRRVQTYSLGMRQRLGLALALMHDPELLVLDEPTNGLDPAGIHEMRDLICSLPEYGITVFLSSHLLSEVEQVATHLGIIQKGRLLFQGTPETLHARVDQHLILEVDQPQHAKALLHTSGWQVKHNGNHHMVVAANSPSDVAMINRQLVKAGVNIYQLNLERPTLEDIFLNLTA